jgi:hypothetical protein
MYKNLLFLHFGAQQGTLEYLKELFHYNFNDLSEGFIYLGFFLKLDSYKVEDWQWLISKFEKLDNPLVQSLAIPRRSLRAHKSSIREPTSLLDGFGTYLVDSSKSDSPTGFLFLMVRKQAEAELSLM